MPYQELLTEYSNYKYIYGKKALPSEDYYSYALQEIENNSNPSGRESAAYFKTLGESYWYKNKCPYYNIHTNLVSRLCSSDLSKIPSNLFKLPHGLNSVHLKFKDPHAELGFILPPNYDEKIFVSSIIVNEYIATGNKRRAIFVLHFQSIIKSRPQPTVVFTVLLAEENTLEDAIESCISKLNTDFLARNLEVEEDTKSIHLSHMKTNFTPFVKNILKLSCTIGFLADNTTICEPDILNSDKHLIENASPEEREALHQKAKNKRKYGWNIGTDRMFVGPQPFQLANKSQAAEGKEREYAHIRAGHPHAVRYGKGKELVKIMWFVPLTVRPDLPFKIEQQTQNTL